MLKSYLSCLGILVLGLITACKPSPDYVTYVFNPENLQLDIKSSPLLLGTFKGGSIDGCMAYLHISVNAQRPEQFSDYEVSFYTARLFLIESDGDTASLNGVIPANWVKGTVDEIPYLKLEFENDSIATFDIKGFDKSVYFALEIPEISNFPEVTVDPLESIQFQGSTKLKKLILRDLAGNKHEIDLKEDHASLLMEANEEIMEVFNAPVK